MTDLDFPLANELADGEMLAQLKAFGPQPRTMLDVAGYPKDIAKNLVDMMELHVG
jgi:hypothetical protein